MSKVRFTCGKCGDESPMLLHKGNNEHFLCGMCGGDLFKLKPGE